MQPHDKRVQRIMSGGALGEDVAGLADAPGVWVGEDVVGEGLPGLVDVPGDADVPGDEDTPGEVDVLGDVEGEVDTLAPGAFAVDPAHRAGIRP